MKNVILQPSGAPAVGGVGISAGILRCLPERLAAELYERVTGRAVIEELRLHGGGRSCVVLPGETVVLDTVLDLAETEHILNALCGGSMYAHAQTLREGYVTLPDGIRVGVCGRLRLHEGKVLGLGDITSLIFRFPRPIAVPVDDLCRLLRGHPGRGLLIYSPPGVGKTTVLRSLIRALAAPSAGRRDAVAVVDTREELAACGTAAGLCADWLSGYPRAQGIEIATRTLGAQIIVCDEIGDAAEADAICAACNAGVSLVASAHASSVEGLLRRRGLRQLHEHGVFGSYVGLSRTAGQGLMRRITPADMAGGR